MLKPDLHIHTTASDGVLTPSKVVLRAVEHGVNVLAISDHDSLNGVAEAQNAAKGLPLRVIGAVEFSCGGDANVHLLGYGLSAEHAEIQALLARMKTEREDRARKMLQKLDAIGLHLEENEIPTAANAVKGRVQIARAMLAKGYVRDVQEAFVRYIGSGCPAYVPRENLEVTEAITLILRHGGVPVLAHPGQLKMDVVAFNASFERWMQAGLMGLEVYHPSHRPDAFAKWDHFARSRGLLVTGGSDFHEQGDKHADVGEMISYWPHHDEDAQRFLRALDR